MTYRAVYTEAAVRQIDRLDSVIRDRVRQAIERIVVHPELGKPLKGLLTDRRSYRVGDWRIIYTLRRSELLILVLAVGHRREVYRR